MRPAWNEGSGVKERAPLEGEVSWTFSRFPEPRAQPGAAAASDDPQVDADIDAAPLGYCSVISRLGAKVVFSSQPFVEAVRGWIADPPSNYGILLRAANESVREVLNLASRQHPVVSYRPKLVVESDEHSAFEVPPPHFADP